MTQDYFISANKEKNDVEYPFEFSVVMAIYNVEPFLREAVDSLLVQDFGFKKIQLIMIDDGSTDGSSAICDEYGARYPKNVVVIHKEENGGASSARNEGLKYVRGRYVNFLDSDDKLSANTMRTVFNFFRKHENETDVVAIPLYFFDGAHGPHALNEKFNRGSRVVDLFREPSVVQLSMASTFLKQEVIITREFDSQLAYTEDGKLLMQIFLTGKATIGLVRNVKYWYRRRTEGERSAIQNSERSKEYYVPWVRRYCQEIFDFSLRTHGYVPKFVQYAVCYDFQWRFKEKQLPRDILSVQEMNAYRRGLFESLQYIDDDVILSYSQMWAEQKCYMLSQKYNCPPDMMARPKDLIPHFKNSLLMPVSKNFIQIEFLGISNGELFLEGNTKILGITRDEKIEMFLLANEERIPCKLVEREGTNKYALDDLILRGIGFQGRFNLDSNIERYEIRLVLLCRGVEIVKTNFKFGKFSPLSTTYTNAYYCVENWSIQSKENRLIIEQCGRRGILRRERHFLKELWKKNKLGARKAVFVRLLCHLMRLVKRKNIWLISDRVNKADDNGEALFRYLMAEHPKERRYYFAISKDAPDYHRLKKVGKVVPFMGWWYKLLVLCSDCIISSQGEDYIFRPFQSYSDSYRDLQQDYKFVFLQHGIIKDDLSDWLNRYSKNLYGFVTSVHPEYRSIIEGNYFYSERKVWLTGLPRYDRLYHDEKRYITLMPTWRAALVGGGDVKTGTKKPKSGFTDSMYFRMYTELFQCKRLFDAAEKLGYQIRLMNHPNMLSTQKFFLTDRRLQRLAFGSSYREIFAQSDMVITDYSSVAFDFAYLRKPVLYYQMDEEEFYEGQIYEKGYFSYDQDGFGEVERDTDSLVNQIIEYMENGCKLKEKYRERIDKFFAFNDQKNCERVYEKIRELEGER